MKQISTLLLCIFCINTYFAQTGKKNKIALNQHQAALVNGLLQNQVRRNLLKAPATERVIAQSTMDNTSGTLSDSVKLMYPINGTSAYDFNQMLYAYNYPYSTSPMFNYLGTYTKPQVEFSSYYHWTIDPNTLMYGFFEKDFAGYDVNKNLLRDTAIYADSSSIPNMTFINKFNTNNDIDTGYWYNYSAGVSTNKFRQFFKYNSSNELVKDSVYQYHGGTWRLASKTFYTYDVSNNLIQIDNFSNTADTSFTMPLIEQAKYTNTYDGSNRLLTVATSIFDSTTLVPSVIDTFAYTGTYTFHTSWKQYQYDKINAAWAPIIHMYKHLNVAGYPDTVHIDGYDTFANMWTPSARDYITYDAFNNPIKLYDYEYNFTSFPPTPDFTTTYYYQVFTNTTSVNDIEASKSNVNVYPNPSSNSIMVSGIDTKSLNAVVSLFDMEGKIISKEKLPMQGDNLQFSVSDITPGSYLMMIQDDKGNFIHRQIIVKIK
ncbi:MAG: T9SS type A sorting domain-containing protein [Bacteroidia bacterium]